MRTRSHILATLGAAAALVAAAALPLRAVAMPGLLMLPPDPEAQLLSALSQLKAGDGDSAFSTLSRLTRQEPGFRLAQYMYANLLMARAGRTAIDLPVEQGPAVASLLEEASKRWSHRGGHPGNRLGDTALPHPLLALPDTQRYAVVVDLTAGRLYVVENTPDGLKVVRDVYATIGRAGMGKEVEGDGRTPIGVYRVTSFLPDDSLPSLYGHGAYPVSYPNAWDRQAGRTGYGIWMHGVPHDTYSRPPQSSEGCVAVANRDLESLAPFIRPGHTPVVFADHVDWISSSEAKLLSEMLMGRVRAWLADWESLDTDAYLNHYASDFRAGNMDLPAFAAHKHRVNARKDFIDVKVDQVEMFRYPAVDERLYLVRFRQSYRSDNYSSTSRKEQMWRLTDNGRWEIVNEDNEA